MLVAALKRFMKDNNGLLPCVSSIMDMTATTKNYLQLKELYANKADAHEQMITQHTNNIISEQNLPIGPLTKEEIHYFVHNCRGIRVVRARSRASEYNKDTFPTADANEYFEDFLDVVPDEDVEEQRPHDLSWYFILRALERFEDRQGRVPGFGGGNSEDERELIKIKNDLVAETQVIGNVSDALCREMVRYGGACTEMHNISAFMGGIGAQISLKVILRQYVPLNNTYIYNGVHGSATAYRL